MKNSVKIILCFVTLAAIVGLVFVFGNGGAIEQTNNSQPPKTVDGKQLINVMAKMGYSPEKIDAKAGVATLLEIETNNTYDCSSSVRIPKIGYQKMLPATGKTLIEIPAEKAEGTMEIVCSMGMFFSEIKFS